ncbi:MAG: methylmalonyl-CoA mutase family protein [Saprospiraceae bacterium]|nr:methylmalonyl-CoA mutase family protein [Saprospiraceae bacterium]
MTNDLFPEFPSIGKEEWRRQIVRDLKGQPLESLHWLAPDGQEVSPFVHAEDFPTPPPPFSNQANNWEICEDIDGSDPVAARRQSLDALEGGAEGLCFYLDALPAAADFAQMLEGIHLDYIGLHFAGKAAAENPAALLGLLESLARRRGLATQSLRGSLAYDPVVGATRVDGRYMADLIEYAAATFPGFYVITAEWQSEELAPWLQKVALYLEKLLERGIPAEWIARHLQCSTAVGRTYFWEIARLRALQLGWLHLAKAWKLPLQNLHIATRFQPDAYTDELYTNMIRAGSMAMSAVLGGAGRLTVLPYDHNRETSAKYPPAFARRMARNVQHLLKMESGFDQLTDPAAGSYYIETLTRQIAERGVRGLKH